MRKLLFAVSIAALLASLQVQAQSVVARFLFEDAEAAFAKQDYQTTLAKLEEAEKEFGKINPPILYLRIMARNEMRKTGLEFDNIAQLRSETSLYLKDYGNLESVQDQAREVYRILSELKQYPAERAEFDRWVRAEEKRRAEEQARLHAEEARRKTEETNRRIVQARRECPACFPEMVEIPGKSYEIGKYEVTQAQWYAVMGDNPSNYKKCGGDCPVEWVSWDDIQLYLKRLNEKAGAEYRLPTLAEWRFACYAGESTKYCGGNDQDEVASYRAFFAGTFPVGEKKPNAYGIYDMSGNVSEWVQDCAKAGCAERLLVGGSWDDRGDLFVHPMLAENVWRNAQTYKMHTLGFRLARTTRVHGWLGAGVKDAPTGERKGAVIQVVVDGSPGAQAGLLAGDKIVDIDGDDIADSAGFIFRMRSEMPGSVVRIGFVRGGHERTVSATLGTAPPPKR